MGVGGLEGFLNICILTLLSLCLLISYEMMDWDWNRPGTI